MMKRLSGPDDPRLTYDLWCEPEGERIEGNASAWGEPEDSECAAEIHRQLDSGNEWAWCSVFVKCSFTDDDGFEVSGIDSLGCCSYKSRAEFVQPGGYYEDMKQQAFDNMVSDMERAVAKGEMSKRLLPKASARASA